MAEWAGGGCGRAYGRPCLRYPGGAAGTLASAGGANTTIWQQDSCASAPPSPWAAQLMQTGARLFGVTVHGDVSRSLVVPVRTTLACTSLGIAGLLGFFAFLYVGFSDIDDEPVHWDFLGVILALSMAWLILALAWAWTAISYGGRRSASSQPGWLVLADLATALAVALLSYALWSYLIDAAWWRWKIAALPALGVLYVWFVRGALRRGRA